MDCEIVELRNDDGDLTQVTCDVCGDEPCTAAARGIGLKAIKECLDQLNAECGLETNWKSDEVFSASIVGDGLGVCLKKLKERHIGDDWFIKKMLQVVPERFSKF